MSISKTRHDRKRLDGEPMFIVRTPIPLTRKFMGVDFIKGVGVTKFAERAKRFDEEFGYEVQLPKGYTGWKLAKGNRIEVAVELGDEDGDGYSGEDEDELVTGD